jgi:hypothetical protein
MSPNGANLGQVMNPTPKSKKITIGCVPEHFSGPIYFGQCHNIFSSHLIDLEIVNQPGGTGQMIDSISMSKIEIGVTLTEGTVLKACKDLIDNVENPLKVLGSYTLSTLRWAISISPSSTKTSIADLKGCKIGISRYGSGSHIMAIVMALQNNFITSDGTGFEFVILDNISGLLKGIKDGIIDCFLWEVITTKPYYDTNIVKLLDIVQAPWDSFVLSTNSKDPFTNFFSSLGEAFTEFKKEFKGNGIKPNGIDMLLTRNDIFHYPNREDVEEWFDQVEFSENPSILSKSMMLRCINSLIKANLIDKIAFARWEREHGTLMVEAICHRYTSFK